MSNDWMDISVPIYTGMAHWPDNPPVRVEHLLHIRRGDILGFKPWVSIISQLVDSRRMGLRHTWRC